MNKLTDRFNLEGCLFVDMDGSKAFLTDQIEKHKERFKNNRDNYAAGDAIDMSIAAAMCHAERADEYTGEAVLSHLQFIHSQLGIFIRNLETIG